MIKSLRAPFCVEDTKPAFSNSDADRNLELREVYTIGRDRDTEPARARFGMALP